MFVYAQSVIFVSPYLLRYVRFHIASRVVTQCASNIGQFAKDKQIIMRPNWELWWVRGL